MRGVAWFEDRSKLRGAELLVDEEGERSIQGFSYISRLLWLYVDGGGADAFRRSCKENEASIQCELRFTYRAIC
jgi:hypothetical protein